MIINRFNGCWFSEPCRNSCSSSDADTEGRPERTLKKVCGAGLLGALAFSLLMSCNASAFAAGEDEDVYVDSVSSDGAVRPTYTNKKQSHLDFQNQNVITDTVSTYGTVPKMSDYMLFAGSIIPATLVTGLNTDLPGQVIGQVSQNVYDSITGEYLLIPQGTRLLGTYNSNTDYLQSRAEIIWTRMILPNGDNMVLPNFNASDSQGYIGVKDKVRSHYARVIWTSILGGLATAGVSAAGASNSDSDYANEARASAAENISNMVDDMVQKNLDVQPTLIIRPGFKFTIMIDKDLVLRPYEG